jgi:hypothetical protein
MVLDLTAFFTNGHQLELWVNGGNDPVAPGADPERTVNVDDAISVWISQRTLWFECESTGWHRQAGRYARSINMTHAMISAICHLNLATKTPLHATWFAEPHLTLAAYLQAGHRLILWHRNPQRLDDDDLFDGVFPVRVGQDNGRYYVEDENAQNVVTRFDDPATAYGIAIGKIAALKRRNVRR